MFKVPTKYVQNISSISLGPENCSLLGRIAKSNASVEHLSRFISYFEGVDFTSKQGYLTVLHPR